MDSFRKLEDEGFEITFLNVNSDGLIDPKDLENAIREDTIGASFIAVHNEIGAINNLEALGQICRDHKIFFHTDGAQATGKIPIDVKEMKIDLMSISGHKVHKIKFIF